MDLFAPTPPSSSSVGGPGQAGPSTVTAAGPDRGGAAGRKRKQNQACSACKTRKVRCNLVDLPEGSVCTPCINKGIKCVPQKAPDGPRKINRSGKRVEAAKLEHGAVDYSPSSIASQAQPFASSSSTFVPLEDLSPAVDPSFSSASYSAPTDSFTPDLDAVLASLSTEFDPFLLPGQASTSSTDWIDPSYTGSNTFDLGVAPHPMQFPLNMLPLVSHQSAAYGLQVKTLELGLEQDLLQTFFSKAHFAVQAVDPEEFRTMFTASLHNPAFMTPENRTICAFMAAWGARYTTHPSVLPPGLGLVECGQARENACQKLYVRARDMVDTAGVLRTPSKESIAVLILSSQLAMYNHDLQAFRGQVGDEAMKESILIKGMMASHIQVCGLWEAAEDGMGFANSDIVEIINQIKKQRMLWTAWIVDSFWSAGFRGRPSFDDNQIFDICPFIPRMGDPLPRLEGLSSPQCFGLLLFAYPMLGEIMRFVGNHIHSRGKRGTQAERTAQLLPHYKVFEELLTDFREWFDGVGERVLGRIPTMSTFSPINWFISVRFGVAQASFFVQQVMSTRLQQWQAQAAKSARPSTVFDTDDGSPKENEELNNLTFLADRSTDFAILNARYIAQLTQKLSNGPHLESAGTEHRELRTLASFLASTETVEHGARESQDDGMSDWTWETKCREVGYLLDAIAKVGWSWGLNGVQVVEILRLMEATRPLGCPKFDFETPIFTPAQLFDRQNQALQPDALLNSFSAGFGPFKDSRAATHDRTMMMKEWVTLSKTTVDPRPLDEAFSETEPFYAHPFALILEDDMPTSSPLSIVASTSKTQYAFEPGLLDPPTSFSSGSTSTAHSAAALEGRRENSIAPSWLDTPSTTLGDFIDNL